MENTNNETKGGKRSKQFHQMKKVRGKEAERVEMQVRWGKIEDEL